MATSALGKRMKGSQDFPFMLLPPELRNQIYALFLVGPRPISVYLVGRTLFNDIRHFGLQTALLRTSRQCYQEGMASLYGGNIFNVYSVDLRGWDSDHTLLKIGSGKDTKTSKSCAIAKNSANTDPALPATALDHITTLNVTSSFLYDSNASPQSIPSSFFQRLSDPKRHGKSGDAERLLLLFPSLRILRVYYDTARSSDEYVTNLLGFIDKVPKNVDFELVMSKSGLAAANPDVEVWRRMKERKPDCLLARKYSRWEDDEGLAARESRKRWGGVLMKDPYPLPEEIVESS